MVWCPPHWRSLIPFLVVQSWKDIPAHSSIIYLRVFLTLHLRLLYICVHICKWSYKGDHDGLALGQDGFCSGCHVGIYSQVLMSYLLEVLTGLVSTFTLILILSPLKGLLPCWWIMLCKYLWFDVEQVLHGEGWENPVPWDSGVTGEMWSSEDKRSLMYDNILKKVILTLHLRRPHPGFCLTAAYF